MKKRPFSLALLILMIGLSGIAHADLFDTYGYGVQGMSMGGAMCSVNDGLSGIYYNPATLGRSRDGHQLGLSYFYTAPSMNVEYSNGTEAGAPPNSDFRFGSIIFDAAIDFKKLFRMERQITLAIAFNLKDDLAFLQMEDVGETRYRFVEFGAPLKRALIYAGLGVEVFRDLIWLGLGAHLITGGEAVASMSIQADDLSTDHDVVPSEQDIWMDMKLTVNPTAGIVANPVGGLYLGFSYKDDVDVQIDPFKAPINLTIGANTATINAYSAILCYWSPRILRGGLSYVFESVTLSFDLAWSQWSEFKRNLPIELSSTAPEFNDTFTCSAGMEYRIGIFKIWSGYQYAQTPVPDQPELSNYLGSNRHILSVGSGVEFADPLGLLLHPVSIGLALQEQILESRVMEKDTGDNYTLKGNVFSFMLTVRMRM